ncbi:hypothetical protein [Facklamia miroungae]|uniref:Uncharacterized protein n=1 Tax=Facklamia miroungae TaxID=120956 RepID=A0A1G7NXC8_9LACT|nr:hypothetical protein [Facklamia miroungae]NKZ28480.1 hypothetical protein [Facklamia miroungae]SDF78019.1 hypothetical protein SAMN05421791_10119 [Facklamia miroungae]
MKNKKFDTSFWKNYKFFIILIQILLLYFLFQYLNLENLIDIIVLIGYTLLILNSLIHALFKKQEN